MRRFCLHLLAYVLFALGIADSINLVPKIIKVQFFSADNPQENPDRIFFQDFLVGRCKTTVPAPRDSIAKLTI
jgi:hypothetical protein